MRNGRGRDPGNFRGQVGRQNDIALAWKFADERDRISPTIVSSIDQRLGCSKEDMYRTLCDSLLVRSPPYRPNMNRSYHLTIGPLDPKSFAPGSRSQTRQLIDEEKAGLYPDRALGERQQ